MDVRKAIVIFIFATVLSCEHVQGVKLAQCKKISSFKVGFFFFLEGFKVGHFSMLARNHLSC